MSIGDDRRGEWVDPLRAERETRGDAVVVRAFGQVDSHTASELGEQLAAAFTDAAAGRGPVVVDLTGVDFLASVGLSLLVEYHQLGVRRGTPLRVVAPARNPLRALRATMLDQTLELYRTVPEALSAVS
ncbi:STAS domain-containing protein [Umezawaea endophytica]|uniref:Anti-sigma factor antagonist n=1 Tax=Umezawaea endophytica TaxID=1654476 RepID=A0A9X3AEC3_9PSEU|nr:STAS domain-containing protein [Umezawaea endophytica]MCS7475755.1 STAS domain-containing protein [Umezawaea endophytica]